MDGVCSMHEREANCIQYFGRKPEGKRPLGRPRCRGENIRMDLRCETVDRMHLAQDREQWRALLNTVMNLRVP